MNETAGLKREELLAAIDVEIGNAQTALSSAGHNKWALTLSMSALVWLGLQSFAGVDWRHVALIAVTVAVLWDFVLKVIRILDTPLAIHQSRRGRFLSLSPVIGALRSAVLFSALKQAALLATILWLGISDLTFLKWYFVATTLGGLVTLACSFIHLPPLPIADVYARSGLLRASNRLIRGITWIARIGVASACVAAIVSWAPQISALDIRLGLIIVALSYLVTLLVNDRFPANHLTALQMIRQNLAFGRVSVDDAQRQTDVLLFVGTSPAASMQHSPEALLADAHRVRSLYVQAENLLPMYQDLGVRLSDQRTSVDVLPAKRGEFKDLHARLMKLRDEAALAHTALLKRVRKFEGHIQTIALFSASAAREFEPLVSKLKLALEPLQDQRCNLERALAPNLTVLPAPENDSPNVRPSSQHL